MDGESCSVDRMMEEGFSKKAMLTEDLKEAVFCADIGEGQSGLGIAHAGS